MKKRMLLIANLFYPESDGTIACLERILPYLAVKYDITVMCSRTKRSTLDEERFGASIKRYSTIWDRGVLFKDYVVERIKLKIGHYSRLLSNTLIIAVRVMLYPFKMLSKKHGVLFRGGYEKNFFNLIKHDLKKYDYLMCTVMPRENADIALNILKIIPDAKWILLQFDMYAGSNKEECEYNQRIAEMEVWYKRAALIVIQKEMVENLNNSRLYSYKDKIIPLFIPSMGCIIEDEDTIAWTSFQKKQQVLSLLLPNNRLSEIPMFDENSKLLVYAGLFYEEIRNPICMLEYMKRVCELDRSIFICLIGDGCEEIVLKYKEHIGEQLIICGHQPRTVTGRILECADILINVGNTLKEMVPSKIMEYIGYRKPIINFYSIEEDTCEKYLKDYPLHYSIKENADAESIDKPPCEVTSLLEFIHLNYRQRYDYSSTVERYGRYSASEFARIVMDFID